MQPFTVLAPIALNPGSPALQTSATAFNEGSSRSHTIIRITIEASGAGRCWGSSFEGAVLQRQSLEEQCMLMLPDIAALITP